ncbi:MAG: hypothetical protein PHC70_00500 [Patescibacteria group bacterium]|nr:hypothetical protein [Patescibacteria group bacterium]
MTEEERQVVSKEWCDLSTRYLKTPEGQAIIQGLLKGELNVFLQILLAHAHLLRPDGTDVRSRCFRRRSDLMLELFEKIQKAHPDSEEDQIVARRRCYGLFQKATNVAQCIISKKDEQLNLNKGQETVRPPDKELAALVAGSAKSSSSHPVLKPTVPVSSVEGSEQTSLAFMALALEIDPPASAPETHTSIHPALPPPARGS